MQAANRTSIRWPIMAMLIVMLWAAFSLRLEHLTDQSLWFDEAATAVSLFYARLNPLIVEARVMVYLLLIAPFVAAVPTDFGLRWPSVIAGVLAVALMYRIGKRLHSPRAGLIAAALLTISPHFIDYSREARYYSIVPLMALITFWLALRLNPARRAINGWFVASVMLLAGLHLLAVLWIGVLLIGLALRRRITGQDAGWGVLICAAVGTALMVIGLYVLGLIGRVGLVQGVTQGAVDAPHRLTVAFLTTGWGMIVPRDLKIVLLALFVALMAVGLWRVSQVDCWTLLLLSSVTLIPVLGLIVMTYLYRPIYLYRYLMPSFATLIPFTAIALAHIRMRWVAASALGVLMISGMLSFVVQPDRQREDWRGAAAYLEAHRQAGDQVFACRARAAIPLTYYLPDLKPYTFGNIPFEIRDHTQPPPAVIAKGSRAWIVQHQSVVCAFADYGIDASALREAPTDIVHFKAVTLLLYESR